MASNYAMLQPALVTIPCGTFMMGSGTDYGVHQTTISEFRLGRTPVTNEEYLRHVACLGDLRYALLGADPKTMALDLIALASSEGMAMSAVKSAADRAIDVLTLGGLKILDGDKKKFLDSLRVVHIEDHKPEPGFDGPRQPVINVSWYQAMVFAFLHGGTLPTEWQWEYAARVINGAEALRDYATPSGLLTREEAHFGNKLHGIKSTADVDDQRYPDGPNGLRHMTGNVWEWMQNKFGEYPLSKVVDPIGPIKGAFMSLRGGSWYCSSPSSLRASNRVNYYPSGWDFDIGFRVAAPAKSPLIKSLNLSVALFSAIGIPQVHA